MPTMQKAGSAQGPTADFYMLANNVEAFTRFIDAQSKAQKAGAGKPRGPQLLKILYKIVQSSGIFRDCKVLMKDCIP